MKMVKRLDEHGNPKIPCLLIGEPCALCKSKNEFICNHPSSDRMPYDAVPYVTMSTTERQNG